MNLLHRVFCLSMECFYSVLVATLPTVNVHMLCMHVSTCFYECHYKNKEDSFTRANLLHWWWKLQYLGADVKDYIQS